MNKQKRVIIATTTALMTSLTIFVAAARAATINGTIIPNALAKEQLKYCFSVFFSSTGAFIEELCASTKKECEQLMNDVLNEKPGEVTTTSCVKVVK